MWDQYIKPMSNLEGVWGVMEIICASGGKTGFHAVLSLWPMTPRREAFPTRSENTYNKIFAPVCAYYIHSTFHSSKLLLHFWLLCYKN